MRKLWEALIERIYLWLINTPEDLVDGECVCEHGRNLHAKGKYRCNGYFPPDEEAKEEWQRKWTKCSCVIYIEDRDDDNGDNDPTPTPSELEELYKK